MRCLLASAAGLFGVLAVSLSLGEGRGDPRAHWVYRAPVRADLPSCAGESGSAIDALVRARLLDAGLAPAAPATRLELIRRVTFDLTGLPPTLDEIDAFLADERPDAFERVVDRLLASPRYGERRAQHWLDVVRFAETEGFEYDRVIPGLWRYRDWVIRALNDDMPFDRFAVMQIAGDELGSGEDTRDDSRDASAENGHLVAAGFHRLGPVRRNAGNQEVASSRNEVLTERTDAIGTVFLGLTIGCARCHDHKFDAISQRDYYRLQAYVAATREHDVMLASDEARAAWKARQDAVTAEIEKIKKALDDATGEAETALRRRLAAAEKRLPRPLPTVATIRDEDRTPIHVLERGDWERKGDAVGARVPAVLLASEDTPELPADVERPRTHLARWIADPANPLTARVIANRVWQHHLGHGLVGTPNDFGVNGDLPSHPELLDRLALELIRHGWRLKSLHRAIVVSDVYRQSVRAASPAVAALARERDPDNRLLWRFNRRRLHAEELRDAMLAVAGVLDTRMFGKNVIVPVEDELVELLYKPSQWEVTPARREHLRRSIYLFAKRNLRLPFMEVFDLPDQQTSCARRESSTHAPQALELLNGRLSNELAAAFARRLEREAGEDDGERVRLAYRLATGRPPTAQELALGVAFLEQGSMKELALAIFNLNAFLHVD